MQKSQENNSVFRSEFWGICCESGKKYSQVVRKKFHLSMAALDPTAPASPCVSLMVERGGCQYLLCNLKPDSLLQVNLNLFFDMGEKVTFSLKGRGTVHLSGYHILQDGDQSIMNDSSKSPSRISMDSDIAVDDETDSSEEEEEYEDSDEEEQQAARTMKTFFTPQKVNTPTASPSKKAQTPKETSNKKDAVPKIDIRAAALKTIIKDSQALKKLVSKRTREEETSDEDEESFERESDESSDDANAQLKQRSKDFLANKRVKIDQSTPIIMQGKKMGNQNTPKSLTEVIDLENETPKSGKKSFNKGDPNSSIGRTPMPKKPLAAFLQSSLSDSPAIKKNKTLVRDDESSDDDTGVMDTSVGNKQLNASTESTESKKKRKKKKKKAAAAPNDSQVLENTPVKLNESVPAFKSAKKLPGGLEYEDIRVGHGLEAKKGKLIHVFYTGKLENNKVFDSRQPGTKPFSFKLGTGQVIRGWDVGLEGMKVGGKRKLKIPPHMGYKNQRMGDIPPSSTLHFDVELKAVS